MIIQQKLIALIILATCTHPLAAVIGFSLQLSTSASSHFRLFAADKANFGDEALVGKALFGMGCFWKPQEAFLETPGVTKATVGYANITAIDRKLASAAPSYVTVCTGSDYTEAVMVEYDTRQISYHSLLKVFWQNHDASQSSKTQYRSVVWPLSEAQQEAALQDVETASSAYQKQGMGNIKTKITDVASPSGSFSPAESIHDRYWPKTFTKVVAYVAATLIGLDSSRDPSLDVVIKPILTLIAAWLLFEVGELVVSAIGSFRAPGSDQQVSGKEI